MDGVSFDIRIDTEERSLVDIRGFTIPFNTITILFGESGIGKSLLARAIYGLLDPEELTVTINGEGYDSYLKRPETHALKEAGFFVFQEPSSHLNPMLRLDEQLKEGSLAEDVDDMKLLQELWDGANPETLERLLEVYPKPYRPSGGEKQRMFLAMALKKIDIMHRAGKIHEHNLFVFDEPTGSLDNHYRNVFLALLFRRFEQSRFRTLLVTHDYSMVSEITGKYRHIPGSVLFREMVLGEDGLHLREFAPSVYLTWLERQRKEPCTKSSKSAPLLRMESGVQVFGQELTITREGGDECPLEIYSGGLTYLKAPSGTGKTTLVKTLMGLVRGKGLRLTLDGLTLDDLTPRRFWQEEIWGRKMTMVFQHADEALNPHSTVKEVFLGLPSKARISTASIRKTLESLFDFEITDEFLDKRVLALSGGQKQRLNLLRSLFLDTQILILDEPLNGLDFESSIRVLELIREKQHAGKGILLISHNEEIFDALVTGEDVYYLRSHDAE